MRKWAAEGFHDIYFVSSKRSKRNGKVTHFENNDKARVCYSLGGDSVTLIGRVEFVTDRELQGRVWDDGDRGFSQRVSTTRNSAR